MISRFHQKEFAFVSLKLLQSQSLLFWFYQIQIKLNKEATTGKEEGIWHEPEKALFSKDKGLSDLKLILTKGKNFLNENGKVYLEHAPDQYEELNKFAIEHGYLNFSNLNDLNGDKRVSIYQC